MKCTRTWTNTTKDEQPINNTIDRVCDIIPFTVTVQSYEKLFTLSAIFTTMNEIIPVFFNFRSQPTIKSKIKDLEDRM